MSAIRSQNIWSPALAASQCLFRFAWALGDGEPAVREIHIPHDLADAFGGLHLLADLERRLAGRFAPIFPTDSTGEFGGFTWRHLWRPCATIPLPSDRTVTQRYVSALLSDDGLHGFESVSLAIALDDLKALVSPWGNSLALVSFERASLLRLAEAEKTTWRAELEARAERTSTLLARRPALARRSGADLLLSSIGTIDAWPWSPRLDPRSLVMVPTPASSTAANIVLWTAAGFQAMTVCAKPEHPVLDRMDLLERHWRTSAP